jgi:hypothetical protein
MQKISAWNAVRCCLKPASNITSYFKTLGYVKMEVWQLQIENSDTGI